MSLRAFFLNWLGAKVPEDQLLNIEHPRFEVQWYTTMKCMQLGAVLGYAYAMRVPVMRYLGRPMTPMVSRVDGSRSILRSSRAGMLGGLVASFPVAMIYAQQKRLNTEGAYYRRAVELRNNNKQLNLDRGSILMGLGTGAFYKGMFGLPLSLGFAQGMALGTIGVGIYNNLDWLYRKKEQVTDKNTFDKLSDKVQEQAENAKGSFRKVSHQAQERAEDAKGSLKKVAEDTKDAFKRVSEDTKDAFKKVSEEGKDSLKKASYKAQDYATELKNNANELKNKAKETAQNEYKKMEHRAD